MTSGDRGYISMFYAGGEVSAQMTTSQHLQIDTLPSLHQTVTASEKNVFDQSMDSLNTNVKDEARHDEDNPLKPMDNEGNHNEVDRGGKENKKPSMVTIDTTKMAIKEGWLWKKGSGVGLFSRTNWTRRYFKFDMSHQVTKIYYYKNEMPSCSPQREAETREMHRNRKRMFSIEQQKQSRGFVYLMYATMNIPGVRRHMNPSINPSWVFEVAVPSRTFQLCAESQEEFDMWTQTIGYIASTIQTARENIPKPDDPQEAVDRPDTELQQLAPG